MIFDVAINMFLFCSLCIVYRNKMFIIITQLEISFIENLIFFNMGKHLQRAAAFIKIIVIGKQVAEIIFEFFSCFIGKIEYVNVVCIERAAVQFCYFNKI